MRHWFSGSRAFVDVSPGGQCIAAVSQSTPMVEVWGTDENRLVTLENGAFDAEPVTLTLPADPL